MEILKEKTKSICPECFKELEAKVFEEDRRVFLERNCPEHGRFLALIEEDAEFYKKIMNREFTQERVPFKKLALPVTFQCNLNCEVCYEPQRNFKDSSLEELKEAISDFEGGYIKLTGGEPTTSQNLISLIKFANESGKDFALVTNGINLKDKSYVKLLKEAGLKSVALAFHGGFKDSIYEKINGEKLLKKKLKAIENLKKADIEVILSFTLIRGVNETELKKLYRYYLKNQSFIRHLRIRSLAPIGRYPEVRPFFLSEIIELLSKVTGFNKDELIESYFRYKRYHSSDHCYSATCRFRIDLFRTFIYRIEKKGFQRKRFKKLRFILECLSLFGIRGIVEMITNIIKRKPLGGDIEIRVWPDKQRIDLGEMQLCPTALFTRNKEFLPFCYAIIMDE